MARKVEFEAHVHGDEVVWHSPDGRPAKDHKLHVAHGEPAHTIEFKLNDKTGLGLSFDQADPIHVWEKDGCPPAGIDTDQIEVVSAESQDLTVLNRNTGHPRTLQYQLNVVTADGKHCPCDPIIKNDGGSGTA